MYVSGLPHVGQVGVVEATGGAVGAVPIGGGGAREGCAMGFLIR